MQNAECICRMRNIRGEAELSRREINHKARGEPYEYDVPFFCYYYCFSLYFFLLLSSGTGLPSLGVESEVFRYGQLPAYAIATRGRQKENIFYPHTLYTQEIKQYMNNIDSSGPSTIGLLLIYWRCPIVVKSLLHFAAFGASGDFAELCGQ